MLIIEVGLGSPNAINVPEFTAAKEKIAAAIHRFLCMQLAPGCLARSPWDTQ